MSDGRKNWGALLQQYRRRNSLTQEALSEFLCVDQTTLSRWERGAFEPSLHAQKRLHQVLLPPSTKMSNLLKQLTTNYDGIAVLLDRDTCVICTSLYHQRELGYDMSGIVGKKWLQCYSPYRAEAAQSLLSNSDPNAADGVTLIKLSENLTPGDRFLPPIPDARARDTETITMRTNSHLVECDGERFFLLLAKTCAKPPSYQYKVEKLDALGNIVSEWTR